MKRMRLSIMLTLGLVLLLSCSSVQSKENVGELTEVEASKIIKKLSKGEDIVLINSIIKGDLDFTELSDYTQLSSPTQLTTTISQTIYFQNCVFMGKVVAHDKSLHGKDNQKQYVYEKVHFKNSVVFFDCDFRDIVNFNESTFDRGLDFNQAAFREKVTFNHISTLGLQNQFVNIIAEKSFQMISSSFVGNLNFKGAKFSDEVNFQGITVCDLQMSNIEVQKEVSLSNASFMGNLYFNYVTCGNTVSFAFSRYLGRVDILQCQFNGDVSMERALFYGQVRFNRSKFEKDIQLVDSRFFLEPELKVIIVTQPISIETIESKTIKINP